MTATQKPSEMKPLNELIQVCPICGKIDAYKDDGHDCYEEINNRSEP